MSQPSLSFRAQPGAFSGAFGQMEPSRRGGFSFWSEYEGVDVSFSFQHFEERAPTPTSYSSYLWGQQGIDLLPADGESALRELSSEELDQTGSYGSLLHLMVARYKPETVEAALDLFPDSALSSVDEHGQTVLHAMAAYGGSEAALDRVLQRIGAQILATANANGALPLHVAAQKSLGLVARILEETPEEALANKTAQGANVLHMLAESKGSEDLMQACIARLPKECLGQQDAHGRTPMHTAVEIGNEVALLLLEAAPADVMLMEDDRGLCILEVALLKGLLGSAFPISDGKLPALIDIHVRNGIMERKKEWRTISPLHAALGRCKKAVAVLLTLPQAKEWLQRCDPVSGVLPIHYVVWKSNLMRRFDLVPVLELMSPEDIARPIVGSNTTALHLAVMKSDGPFGQQLLDAAGPAFDVDAVDAKGRSLLALAMTMGRNKNTSFTELMRRILTMSASRTPLTVADWRAVVGHVDVSLLLAICARYERNFFAETVPEEWEGGTTPLYCACDYLGASAPFVAAEAYKRDLVALLELLPEWFVTVRHTGHTPLHRAADFRNLIAVELLLRLPSGPTAAKMFWDDPGSRGRGCALEVALGVNGKAEVDVVRAFLAMVPGIRSVAATSGQSLAEYVDSLYASDPDRFAEIKVAFAPAVKSAAQ